MVDPRLSVWKRLEIAARRLLTRLVTGSRVPDVVSSPTDTFRLRPEARILFLRQDRIGDVLITTPIIREIRSRYPDARIDVVLSRNNVAVRHTVEEFVDHILVYNKTLESLMSILRQIRRNQYDLIVDLLDNASTTSSVFLRGSRSQYRLGIDKENRGVYTHVVPLLDRTKVHVSDRIARLMLPFGVDPAHVNMRPHYPVTPAEREAALRDLGHDPAQPAVGVILSGSLAIRRYGPERTIDVLNQLAPRYPTVQFYVFGMPSEREDMEQIAQATGAKPTPPSTTFHHYATRLRVMDALWTPDTAAVHLAAAWQMPVCGMFIRDVDQRYPWYPYNTHCEAVFSPTDALSDTPVHDVVAGIERLFAYCTFEPTA